MPTSIGKLWAVDIHFVYSASEMAKASPPPPPIDTAARIQLRAWMRASGATQTQVGTAIGRNQAWMSRFFKGAFTVDLDTWEALAAVFGHSLAQLIHTPIAPTEEQRLVMAWRTLRPEGRAVAIKVLEEWSAVAVVGRTGRRRPSPSRRR